MSLTFKQLEAFIWVCDLGSFGRAAERLNTTQPNISSRILALENLLETRLMERDAGSVRLTAKGRELLEHARHVQRSVEKFIEVAGRSHLNEGVLKLGVTELVVNTWLRDFLRLSKQAFPNVDIELTIDLSVNISEALHDHTLDLALQSSPFQRPINATLALGTYAYVWVASPRIVKQQDGLGHIPILTHTRGTIAVEEIEQHFAKRRGAIKRLVPSSNMAACLHMAIDGLGVAVLPEAMVQRDVKAGRLALVDYHWSPKPLKMCARYHAEKAAGYVGKIAQLAKQVAQQFNSGVLQPSK